MLFDFFSLLDDLETQIRNLQTTIDAEKKRHEEERLQFKEELQRLQKETLDAQGKVQKQQQLISKLLTSMKNEIFEVERNLQS